MYSPKLQEVVSASRPEVLPIGAPALRGIAQALNLEVISYGEKGLAVGVIESEESLHLVYLPLSVEWKEKFEGDRLSFVPKLRVEKSKRLGGCAPELEDQILEAIGLQVMEVQLPELVVALPWASWCDCMPVDWGGAGLVIDTTTCFLSEAREILGQYLGQLPHELREGFVSVS